MDSGKRPIYEFGDFILEGAQRRLLRRVTGEPVALTSKVFDTLLYLVEHRGEMLDKNTLLKEIWPGVIVEENNLTQSISALRQALGERPGTNRYVATVPRKGYRFVSAVTELDSLEGANAASTPAPVVDEPKRSWRWTWPSAAIAAVVIFALTFLFVSTGERRSAPPIQTLAVLPFKPLIPADRDESLELGLTESMIANLGARDGLILSPLSSVRRYGSIDQDPLAAGRALHADAVLDGSLQRHEDKLRVSTRLLRVADGRQLWSHQYDGTTADIFDVQKKLSAKIAEALSVPESAESTASHALGGTEDSTAYLLYASGRYALARSTEPSVVLAISYFERAIARDPGFALAHAGLANCYMILGIFGMRAPAETLPRARDAALKALQLEPRLAAAYGTLGHIKMQYDRDWDGAEADFVHAIALDRSLSEPHMYRGVLLAMRGELDRGIDELQQAQRLEPLLTLPKTRLGAVLYFARRYDEAIAQLTESLALDDRPGVAHAALGRVYLHTGRYEQALAEFAKIDGQTPGSFGDVGQALALSGHRTEALAELDRVLKLSTQRYVSAVDIASLYASLGDTENALTWLDRALDQRASTLGFLAQNPAFDGLHGNPRFTAIVSRVGARKELPAK